MRSFAILGLGVSLLSVAGAARAESDAPGCKDVFVTRLAGFVISSCEVKQFDAFVFAEGYPGETRVEGRIVQNNYSAPDEAHPLAPLQVRKNYENTLKQAGWTVVYADPDTLVEKLTRDGQERWLQLQGNGGSYYSLVLGQSGAMEQSVTTADGMLAQLNKEGHVALQINFDSGKATIRPDSKEIVAQIVALLKGNPALRLSVEGHTDNVDSTESNKALSEARAKAVVAALVARGIVAERLRAAGFGPERPMADNATADGRAKNRRVELVKL
ncbi:MAG: OmpA family protein [Thermoanaerobaculia bacterium]